MTVANEALTIYRGTDPLLVLTATTPPSGGISGWTAAFNLRLPGASAPVLTVAATLADPVNGVWNVQLTRAQTSALMPVQHTWDLSRIDAGADDVLAIGPCYVRSTARDG